VKPVRWHEVAIEEAERAAEYYRSQSEGLDERFSAAVAAAVALLQSYPAIGRRIYGDYRRVIVHRFPYSVVYREDGRFLRVVAVVNHYLDPVNWIGR
jgi:plasmid stabilization system protein ParE